MHMDRTNVFEGTGPTGGTSIKAKIGATKDGKLIAGYADMAYEGGCFPGSSVTMGAMAMFAPYNVEHVKIDGFDVVVNKPKTQDYRAPGAPAASFAIEQLVDELAEKLGIDPLKFRAMNSSHEGTRGPGGMPFSRIGQEECVEAALNSAHYNTPLEGPNRGRGVASGFWFNVGLRSSVTVSVQPDGTVNLVQSTIALNEGLPNSGSTDAQDSAVSMSAPNSLI
jgi:CO/xanthine dehydrogenase Mo-binding subunit